MADCRARTEDVVVGRQAVRHYMQGESPAASEVHTFLLRSEHFFYALDTHSHNTLATAALNATLADRSNSRAARGEHMSFFAWR